MIERGNPRVTDIVRFSSCSEGVPDRIWKGEYNRRIGNATPNSRELSSLVADAVKLDIFMKANGYLIENAQYLGTIIEDSAIPSVIPTIGSGELVEDHH